jgi:2'-5' RNA ligase
MRLFTAIEIPEPVRDAIAPTAQHLKSACPQASWVRRENLHLTLKFLGEVPESQVADVCDALKRVSVVGTARIEVGGLEFFPPRGPVRVIALGLSGEVELIHQIFREVDRTTAEIGFPSEGRPFAPHITFARARRTIHGSARKTLPPLLRWAGSPPTFEVTSFSLIESKLGSGGPEYLRLATFPTK